MTPQGLARKFDLAQPCENLVEIKYKSNVYLVYLAQYDAARSGSRSD
jgi:hypothetical protein